MTRTLCPLLFGVMMVLMASPAYAPFQETWNDADIGATGQAGGSAYDGPSDTYSISGAGSGIVSGADACHFSWSPLHGNGQIIARFTGIQGDSSFPAEGGLMARESIDANAKMAGVLAALDGSLSFVSRTAVSEAAQATAPINVAAPQWLKLVRRGDETVAFRSMNGNDWLLVGSAAVPMAADILVGLNATSGDASFISASAFEHVTISRTDTAELRGGLLDSLALKADGTVWQWGSDDPYSGSPYERPAVRQPTQVAGMDKMVAVASGDYHSMALRSDGTVWTWGNNWNGQLGPRTETDDETPGQVTGLDNVVAVAAASGSSAALKADGTVWAWGWNGCGQLGDGTTNDNGTPRQVAGLSDVVAIATGGAHVLALKSDGTVWAWGESYSGQVGDGTEGGIVLIPAQVTGLSGIVSIAAGHYHSLAIKNDGTAWAWGANWSGQLGDGTTDQHAT